MDIVGHLGEIGLEAHLRYRNSRGENVLHLASKLCNPDMFRLLLPQFPKCIYAEDDIGETPLLLVIMSPSAKRYQPLCDNTFAYKRQPRNLMFGLARARLADYCVASWLGCFLHIDRHWEHQSSYSPNQRRWRPKELKRKRPWKREWYAASLP